MVAWRALPERGGCLGRDLARPDRCARAPTGGPLRQEASLPVSPVGQRDILRELGAVYGRYTGTCFASTTETDIEHIVAASEAHDSGLRAREAATRPRFARDLRNLTLASPRVNRRE